MKQYRRDDTLDREEYLTRAREFAPRGEDSTHSKLTGDQVREILEAGEERARLRSEITRTLGNRALAERFGVSERAIERIFQRETWAHVRLL